MLSGQKLTTNTWHVQTLLINSFALFPFYQVTRNNIDNKNILHVLHINFW